MARDEHVYDLVDFTVWYDGALGLRRWLEAPPVAEVQDEREIALAGMLMTRSAPRGFGAPPPLPLRLHASRAMHLSDLMHQLPELNALVMKYLHHGFAAGLFPDRHQSFACLRQTCPALYRLGRTNPYWWSMWSGKSGCACGRCEAAWIHCGWICPRLYRGLFGAQADP